VIVGMTIKKIPNRLAQEKSPYLLQHANNPVDWYPWSEEAFDKAEKEGKPIFLSIGYSTCHWCHVMEKESFEDLYVAKILNENFVSIKVDREERPDIDSVYITFCQVINGSGGWPLSIFMAFDKKPFFAGTYFPKNDMYGRTGFVETLKKINDAWKNNRSKLIESGNNLYKELSKINVDSEENKMNDGIIEKAVGQLKSHYDSSHGGFSDRPKFPTPHNLYFLLRYYQINKDEEILKMVETSLLSMYKGGIFDHIGFGFSRYSTDSRWLVPHFEKMLYDNALLAIAYIEAYQITKNKLYREIADKIFKYILRDMRNKAGGFFSAEDADSEGVEGKFYLWSTEEIRDVLGEEEAAIFSKYFDISIHGNFEGGNIPNLISTDIEKLQSNSILKENLDRMSQKLYAHREKRIHPFKDDKILTSWNGLMIAALSYAGRVFDNPEYVEAAENAAKFILHKMIRKDGRLLARYRGGNAANPALLDDYAFLVWGLLEAYQATFDTLYLEKAAELNDSMIELFYDKVLGGFFLTGKDGEELIIRPKDFYDGALPSGNSVAVMNLIKLSKLLGTNKYQAEIENLFNYSASMTELTPAAFTFLVTAYLKYITPGKEIVISGNKFNPIVNKMMNIINQYYLPFSTVILNDDGKVTELNPFIKEQTQIHGEATAYICQNFSCRRPTCELYEFEAMIKK
jgi:uncharacterized protein YyaL (SSP411 family)